jgi:hypothetical protein
LICVFLDELPKGDPDHDPRAVAAGAGIAAAEVVACVANLVTKSLIAAEVGGPVSCYRLLRATRAYALEKLADSGELEEVERRHAEHLRDLVGVGWKAPLTVRLPAVRGSRIDHRGTVRDQVLSPRSNVSIGATLMPPKDQQGGPLVYRQPDPL